MTRRAPLALVTGIPVALAQIPPDVLEVVIASFAARALPGPSVVAPDELAAAVGAHAVGAAWIDPDPTSVASLLPAVRAAATAGRPLIVLARPRPHRDGATALAFLRAHGAAVFADPDAWLEALCLLAAHGPPSGGRTAIVADDDGYLAAQAAIGPGDDGRRPNWGLDGRGADATDVVLIAHTAWSDAATTVRALRVPLCDRGERLAEAPPGALVGLRPAVTAIAVVGKAIERAKAGLGPAGRSRSGELDVDHERLTRQLAKVAAGDRRLGDHEAKVLLAAYGVPITRQAVATSPSAAQRIAAKAGFPVDIKPWGPEVASERAGCPVEAGLTSAAEVRRAFTAVLAQGGHPAGSGAVIVRASPPSGRELRVRIVEVAPLGLTVQVEVDNQPVEAAPAPLRLTDANALAAAVVATRAGDDEPDRVGLANLMRRASHLALDHADVIAEISLGRVVVAGRSDGALVVDAEIRLR